MKNRRPLKLLISITNTAVAISSMAFVWLTLNTVMDFLDQGTNGVSAWRTAIFSLLSALSTLLFFTARNLLKGLQKKRGSSAPTYSGELEKVA